MRINDSYQDDPTIPDEARLWRRIPQWHFFRDDNLQRVRPASAAFDDDDGPMSVTLADEAADPESVLTGHGGYGLAEITAGLARQCQQGIVRDPLSDNPAHGLVFGRKTSGVKRRLAKECRWVVPPPDADPTTS